MVEAWEEKADILYVWETGRLLHVQHKTIGFNVTILSVFNILVFASCVVMDNLYPPPTKAWLPQSILNTLFLEHGLMNIRSSITSIRQIYVIAVMLIKDNPGWEYDSFKQLFRRELDLRCVNTMADLQRLVFGLMYFMLRNRMYSVSQWL